MNRLVALTFIRGRLLWCFVVFLVAGADATLHASDSSTWSLGKDPDAIILIFDISGGQRPRLAEGPLLEISASGAASARGSRPGEPRASAQLSAAEVSALLDTVVTDLGAFEIDGDAIGAAVAAAGGRLSRISDASTTSLTLVLGERRKTLSVYALPQQASQYPEVDALQRFLEIRRLLQSEANAIAANAVGAAPAKSDGTARPGKAD